MSHIICNTCHIDKSADKDVLKRIAAVLHLYLTGNLNIPLCIYYIYYEGGHEVSKIFIISLTRRVVRLLDLSVKFIAMVILYSIHIFMILYFSYWFIDVFI